MEVVTDMALQTGAILGLTSLAAKVTPADWRGIALPIVAMVVGVLVVVLPLYVDITPVFQGIVLGGSVTGLYGVAKDMKKVVGTGE